jgi:hypothetical protein
VRCAGPDEALLAASSMEDGRDELWNEAGKIGMTFTGSVGTKGSEAVLNFQLTNISRAVANILSGLPAR